MARSRVACRTAHRAERALNAAVVIEESPSNCTSTGSVDDVRGAYAAGDVFRFPTPEEDEWIALLETMTAGTPVLVRDIETFSWLEAVANRYRTLYEEVT